MQKKRYIISCHHFSITLNMRASPCTFRILSLTDSNRYHAYIHLVEDTQTMASLIEKWLSFLSSSVLFFTISGIEMSTEIHVRSNQKLIEISRDHWAKSSYNSINFLKRRSFIISIWECTYSILDSSQVYSFISGYHISIQTHEDKQNIHTKINFNSWRVSVFSSNFWPAICDNESISINQRF